MDILEKVNNLPDFCGVYLLKSSSGRIIYIGKANNIKKRLKSHLRGSAAMVRHVADIEYIQCERQEQALILEASLIKENKPKYNVELKDDKEYPYLAVTKEKYPRIYVRRLRQIRQDEVRVYGPFTDAKLLKQALRLAREIFPFCTCRKVKKSCFYCHLGLCPAPGKGPVTPVRYRQNIDAVVKVICGRRRALLRKLERNMHRASLTKDFEYAAFLRDKIITLSGLYAGRRKGHELIMLKQILRLKKIPFVIEAIDAACLSGRNSVGSVVVFRDGWPHKSSYRRYKIKQDSIADDCSMIAEIVRRRYLRLKREKGALPDLIVVDGGPTQIGAAHNELKKIGINIALIGIAKKNEEIYLPRRGRPIVLDRSHPALHLVQRLRDEAHRFSHGYHLLLRERSVTKK